MDLRYQFTAEQHRAAVATVDQVDNDDNVSGMGHGVHAEDSGRGLRPP